MGWGLGKMRKTTPNFQLLVPLLESPEQCQLFCCIRFVRVARVREVEAQHGFALIIIESNKHAHRVVMTGGLGEVDLGHGAQINMDMPVFELDRRPGVAEIYAFR